ncbi:hypothetical protein DGWBC_1090 [Dehalogenimonas sp. WBC-2]|nr:hypothetical protein DGWBC_1090 [Dehalogenimonas sp. WBC-2]
MSSKYLKIGIIGAGKTGTALALGLNQAGYSIAGISSRTFCSAEKLAVKIPGAVAYDNPQSVADGADLIFITTPDTAISLIADSISTHPDQMICHVSAADPIDVLAPLRQQGAVTGIFHPLQSIGSMEKASILPGITFALEAEEPLLGILRQMASRLGGHTVELSGDDRVLYHASAVMVSNYLVTLVSLASSLWQRFQNRESAVKALLPLIRGTVDNIETIGIPACLTGPVSRGDAGTVKRHLVALAKEAPEIMDLYRLLAIKTIPLASTKGGIDGLKAKEMKELLEAV